MLREQVNEDAKKKMKMRQQTGEKTAKNEEKIIFIFSREN